jgi:hypothetical protein
MVTSPDLPILHCAVMNPASIFTRVLQEEKRAKLAAANQAQHQQQQQQHNAQNRSMSPLQASTPASSTAESIEEEMAPFHAYLRDLQQPQATVPFREESLFKIFTQLRHSTPAAQIQALDMLSTALTEKPNLIIGCTNLLSLIIRILQSSQGGDDEISDAGTAIACKLFFLISTIANEHMNVRDLKRLFRILRKVVERKAPPLLCRLMLSSLADMAANSSPSTAMYISPGSAHASASKPPPPSSCFDFSGVQSALALPPLEKFPTMKGYSICMWIRWEAQSPPAANQPPQPHIPAPRVSVAQPVVRGGGVAPPAPLAHLQTPPPLSYLYSFLSDKARGIECLVGKHVGNVVIRSCSRGVLQELNSEVRLPDRKWVLLTIVHTKPKTFSRSSGQAQVYVNDELKYEGELAYPQLPEPLVFNAFGAATHPSKPSAPFLGRMSTITFHTRSLNQAQIQVLWRKGADFCITVLNQIERSGKFLHFVSSSLSTIFGAISNAATAVAAQAASTAERVGGFQKDGTGDEDEADTDSSSISGGGNGGGSGGSSASASDAKKQSEFYRDLFKGLLLLFHPRCIESHLALDCAPVSSGAGSVHVPMHASILPGVQVVGTRDIRALIHLAIGGITCFFPLFQHLDVLSPGTGGGGGNGKKTSNASSSSALPSNQPDLSISTSSSTSSPRIRSQSSILPLLFRTLQLMLRENSSNQISFLQASGFQAVSFLLTKYTSVHHLSESLLAPLEEMLREFSWGMGLQRLKSQVTEEASHGASAATATGENAPRGFREMQHTNHSLPVSRAGEKSLYNDFLLHVLLNFSLWFRSTSLPEDGYNSASAALDDLTQQQVPFVVQFEVLLLLKQHLLKNPRYFRRLLSSGGGSGLGAAAVAAAGGLTNGTGGSVYASHASAASIGPVKFVLDSLRRFLSYQTTLEQHATVSTMLAPPTNRAASSSIVSSPPPFFHPFLALELATAVRNLRLLRREWMDILKALMLCPVNSGGAETLTAGNNNVAVVREADITTLLQLISEASEASASSLAAGEANALSSSYSSSSSSAASPRTNSPSPTQPLSSATAAHSWVLSELLEFVCSLLRAKPDEIQPILGRNGGGMLLVSILSRNGRYQHVQVAVIHLLSTMLQHSQGSSEQITLILAALQQALSETYLTQPSYEALMELACGLQAGTLGPNDATEEAIERFCEQLSQQGSAGSIAGGDSDEVVSPVSARSGSSASSSTSNANSPHLSNRSLLPRSTVLTRAHIVHPRAMELIHALLLNNQALRAKEQHRMRDSWAIETRRRVTARANSNAQSSAEDRSHSSQHGSNEDHLAPSQPTHVHRSSDNIHWDESIDVPTAAITIHPPVPHFTLYHPTHNPLHGSHLSTLASPLVPLASSLADLNLLLSSSGDNCTALLSRWTAGMKMVMKELDWKGEREVAVKQPTTEQSSQPITVAPRLPSPDVSSPQIAVMTSEEEENAIASKLVAHRPSLVLGLEIDSLLDTPVLHQGGGSIEEEIMSRAPLASSSSSQSSSLHAPPKDDAYLQALHRQRLRADVDLGLDHALPLAGSSEAISPSRQLASKVLETLLFHAASQIKDGWTSWRDALLLLKLEAEQQQQAQEEAWATSNGLSSSHATADGRFIVTEARFRSVRRTLLIGVFHRLEQLPPPPLTAAGVTITPAHITLHINLSHIVDLLEEALYFDQSNRFKQLRFRMVEGEETSNTSDGSSTVRKTSRMDSSTRLGNSSTTGGGDGWLLMDEDESSESDRGTNDPLSSASSGPAHPSFFRQEWSLIRELLQCLVHLRFSMQPLRFASGSTAGGHNLMSSAMHLVDAAVTGHGSLTPDSASGISGSSTVPASMDASISPPVPSSIGGSSGPLRTGGPLRVVIRMLLDCCSAVCLSTEHHGSTTVRQRTGSISSANSPPSSDSFLTQLQDMVSSLGALVHVELAISTYVNAAGQRATEKSASREWKNRYVLHILWRLCQIMHIVPAGASASSAQQGVGSGDSSPIPSPSEQMRRVLHSTVDQIVESLKPFASVPMSAFDTAPAGSVPLIGHQIDRVIYVPLVVSEEGFLDVDPNFQLPFLGRATTPKVASANAGAAPSALSLPPAAIEASGRSSPALSVSGSNELASSSPLYPRIMRCCNEYIAASVQLFHSMELAFAEAFTPESEKLERAIRKRLREGEGALTAQKDQQRASWRSVQTYSYAEVNRRAVADTFFSDHISRVADQWRLLAHALYSEGSAWCSSEISSRRKFYRIDPVEDGYRMRRKIKIALDGVDHHQASQS